MTDGKTKLRLFLDEGVPASVGREFEKNGHKVIYLQEAIARGSDDVLVCAAAEANDAILVALDADMKAIAKRHGVGSLRFKRLNLIKLSCPEPSAAARVAGMMSLIEHEWQVSEGKAARRLFMEIGANWVRSNR